MCSMAIDQHLGFRPLQCPARTRRSLQICLALTHQLRDCQYAIEAGDEIFAPRMKALLLRAVALARRRTELAESTRRSYQRRLDRDLNAIMVLAPANRHGKRLRKRYGRSRSHLFTFLDHPDTPPDNNCSERELRPTAIPQGDRWLSIELGRRLVRCHPISCRHSRATWHRRLSSNSCDFGRRVGPQRRLSSYGCQSFAILANSPTGSCLPSFRTDNI